MSYVSIEEIPNLIKKLGSGRYEITVKIDKKGSRIIHFSKNEKFEWEELKKILESTWFFIRKNDKVEYTNKKEV